LKNTLHEIKLKIKIKKATYRDVEFQPALVAGSTIALLAVGLVVRKNKTKDLTIRFSQ